MMDLLYTEAEAEEFVRLYLKESFYFIFFDSVVFSGQSIGLSVHM